MATSKAGRSTGHSREIWAILLCFFASGMSGLVYQVIWVRELVLVFGATTFAVSTVLTAFMSGLALGSYYFGRISGRITRPLKLYGLLEIAIGIYGLLVPLIFTALPSIYHPLWQKLHLSFFALSIIRFLLAGMVLVLPTALMGATLPVLSSFYARDLRSIGLRVGSLYSLNTFGAVLGAAATGFVLIPALGMRAATITAAAINILLGMVALAVDRKQVVVTEPRPAEPIEPQTLKEEREQVAPGKGQTARAGRKRPRSHAEIEIAPASRAQIVIVLIGFAFSGFIALSYEVIWSRVLALIIGSSVYAFSIMLTTFLVGLAAGASLASRFVDRARNPILLFAVIEVGVGITSLVGAYLFNDLPYIFVQIYQWLEGSSFALLLFARFLVASLVMIVPTLLLGSLFPLVVRIVTRGVRDLETGQAVGKAYAANTVGAIGGSFASGFVLVPWLGLLGSLKVCCALNFVIAGALFFISDWRARPARQEKGAGRARRERARPVLTRPRITATSGIAVSSLLVLAVVLLNPPWDSEVMSSAVYRYAPAMSNMSRQELFHYLKSGQGETIFYKEGITATVAVQQQNGERVLKVNGKPEASTAGDMPTQILIGSLPMLMREQTENVLMIGLGSGITLGATEQFPVRSITCVELEPAVIEASHYFNDVNNRPLGDPRLRLIANDGRNYIYTTDEKFDVIISEPSNPWLTGVANLFTLEYFKRGAERLNDDGIFTQWLQVYEMSPADVKTLIATFQTAFPYVYVFRGAEGDLMLTGSKRERPFDLSVMGSHFANPKIAAELRRVNTTSAADLISRFYLGATEAAHFASGAPLNTDDNALIEFSAPRRVGTAEETVQLNIREMLAYAASPLAYLNLRSDPGRLEASFLVEAALGAVKRNDLERAEQFTGYALDIVETAQIYSVLGELRNARGDESSAIEQWNRALSLDPNHFYTLLNLGKLYLTKQDIPRAAGYLDRAVEIDPGNARTHHLRGLAYQATGDNLRAVIEYRKALPDAQYTRSVNNFYLNFGTALVQLGYYEEAVQILEEHVKLVPGDFDGHYNLGVALSVMSERSLNESITHRAIDELKRGLAIRSAHAMSHYYLSKAYRRLGLFDEADSAFENFERLSP